MRHERLLRATTLATAAVLNVGLLGQQTLHVGPGRPFAEIQDAVNASSAGDTIVVDPWGFNGVYAPITVQHTLTIRGEPPTTPGWPLATVAWFDATLPASGVLYLQNLVVSNSATLNGGMLRVEGGAFSRFPGFGPASHSEASMPLGHTRFEVACSMRLAAWLLARSSSRTPSATTAWRRMSVVIRATDYRTGPWFGSTPTPLPTTTSTCGRPSLTARRDPLA
jgi:hypothetical protein